MSALKRTLIVGLIAVGFGWPLKAKIEQKRHDAELRDLLLVVQDALQRFHVDQEKYIPRTELKGAEMINVLLDFGFLDGPPYNPWTGEAYVLDGEELDFLRYASDPNFETYALKAMDAKTGVVRLEIDSVEHLSLE